MNRRSERVEPANPRTANPRSGGVINSNRLSWPLLPPSYERSLGHARRVELASDRRFRARNKVSYRLAHWPIWIWVFFIAPGPLTFDLFERGFDWRMAAWLTVVLAGTGIAGLRGKLPGVEPAPYILRFTEDRPNPLYRRVCYTLAWSEVIAFAVLNAAGLAYAIVSGTWMMRQMYDVAYFPIVVTIWVLGALGRLPRVKRVDPGRGARTPLLLRVGLGGLHRAAGVVAALESPAAHPHRRCAQARGIHCHPRLGGQPRPPRAAASHPADPAGGSDRLGLTSSNPTLQIPRLPNAKPTNSQRQCPESGIVGLGFGARDFSSGFGRWEWLGFGIWSLGFILGHGSLHGCAWRDRRLRQLRQEEPGAVRRTRSEVRRVRDDAAGAGRADRST